MAKQPKNPKPVQRTAAKSTAAPHIQELSRGTQRWNPMWKQFQKDHPAWCQQYLNDDPVYAIPEPVMDQLTVLKPAVGSSRANKPVLNAGEEVAERSFSQLCTGFGAHTVGVWQNKLVDFPLLASTVSTASWVSEAIVQFEQINARKTGRPARAGHAQQAARSAYRHFSEHSHQMVGYLGSLICNKPFRQERDQLRSQFFGTNCASLFPLYADELRKKAASSGRATGPSRRNQPSWEKQTFEFLAKWQLSALVTWELPLPQGPVVTPAAAAPPVYMSGVTIHLPTYFDIHTDRAFHQRVIDQQHDLSRSLGVSPAHPLTDIAPTSKRRSDGSTRMLPSRWETAFRLWFVEQTVRSRYTRRHGLITRLIDGLIGWLTDRGQTISPGRVNQVRRLYCDAL